MPERAIRLGDHSARVLELRDVLVEHGHLAPEAPRTDLFDRRLHEAVVYWQQTHLGPNGAPLEVDGWVGESTWWSLEHPDGEAQRSHLIGTVPAGLTPGRIAVLEHAFAVHVLDVREDPNGSNRGPVIDRWLPGWWLKDQGPPWCSFCAHGIVHEALGRWPVGRRVGSCWRSRLLAQAGRGGARWLDQDPVPGDLFVMLYRDPQTGRYNRKGHTGIVTHVSEDGRRVGTAEGNVANRFALKVRKTSTIAGFIDYFGADEQPLDWERGLPAGLQIAGGESTR